MLDAGRFNIFVSAVSSELAAWRDELKEALEARGATVFVQSADMNGVPSGRDIREQIAASQLVICLIGKQAGTLMPAKDWQELSPPGVVPQALERTLSWTQWEYLLAREHVLARTGEAWVMPLLCNQGSISHLVGKPLENADSQQAFLHYLANAPAELSRFRKHSLARAEDVLDLVLQFARNRSGGGFALFGAAQWRIIQSAYRQAVRDRWTQGSERWGADWTVNTEHDLETGEADVDDRGPVRFIANQRMQLLEMPCQGDLEKALSAEAFTAGRDSEAEASARAEGDWLPTSRDQVVAALCGDAAARAPFRPETAVDEPRWPPRIFLIAAGGIGKTAVVQRIEYEICLQPDAPLALTLSARSIGECRTPAAVAALLAEVLVARVGERALPAFVSDEVMDPHPDAATRLTLFVRQQLAADILAGRVIVLIDELDHISESNLPLLLAAQNDRDWQRCPILVAGRPHALRGWTQNRVHDPFDVNLLAWRYVELREFTDLQSRALLGVVKDPARGGKALSRFDFLKANLRGMVRVPRILSYVLKGNFNAKALYALRTGCDVYFGAVVHILERAVEKFPKEAQIPSARIATLLSALGFMTSFKADGTLIADHRTVWYIDETFKRKLAQRMAAAIEGHTDSDLDAELKFLGMLASLVSNGMLESAAATLDDPEDPTLHSVSWTNRSIQHFFAALWLAQHGAKPMGTSDKTDSQAMRKAVYYQDQDERDLALELNRFLADMPLGAIKGDPRSWVEAARVWYDPALVPFEKRRWSTEMLYRSWVTMHLIADRKVDDWWDMPYAFVRDIAPSMRAAQTCDWLARQKYALYSHPNCGPSRVATTAAGECIDAFRADFGRLLNAGTAAQKEAARRFATQDWHAVAPGSFRMGSPDARQGLPSKTEAYWRDLLAQVASGEKSPELAAEYCTPVRWFAGARGVVARRGDIEAMREVFAKHLERARRALPGNTQFAADSLKDIELHWRNRDESPEPGEELQHIERPIAFDAYPLQLKTYALFAAGHAETIDANLRQIDPQSPPYSPECPVIYVNWYDAWAFCEWANWTHEGQRYQCRLPHEPEWEYACRRDEHGRAIPFEQRYWWGDSFYRQEDRGIVEALSDRHAHADGAPGATRDPATSAPNGNGLHDMLGNVWEWCANHYDPRWQEDEVRHGSSGRPSYSSRLPMRRPPDSSLRTLRGGLWYYLDHLATCSNRYRQACDDADYKKGFRVIRETLGPLS